MVRMFRFFFFGSLLRDRAFGGGLVLALCGAKFHLFLLVPLLLVSKHLWRFGLGLITGACILLVTSFLAGGIDWPAHYFNLLMANERGQASQSNMPNLTGLLHGLPFPLVWIAASSLMVAAATWYVLRRVPTRHAIGVVLCGGLLVSPHAYLCDCGFLLPIFLSKAEGRQAGRTIFIAILIGTASLTLSVPSVSFVGQLAVLGLFASMVWDATRTSSGSTTPGLTRREIDSSG
jgi:hypothetical protein